MRQINEEASASRRRQHFAPQETAIVGQLDRINGIRPVGGTADMLAGG